MNNDLAIRSLLVDKSTGRYIKAVDERGIDDYVRLFSREIEKSELVIFDFAKAVSIFHDELDKKLNIRDYRDLTIKRGTVFNTWARLRSLTNEMLICQTAAQISRDAEEVLNWIYTRIPELEKNYRSAVDARGWTNEKNSALLNISNEVEVFLEVLLCHIHATTKVDINYFKSDVIIEQHCTAIRNKILGYLENELDYWNGDFNFRSMIFQICMEDMGLNPEAIAFQIDSNLDVAELRQRIIKTAKIEDNYDGHYVTREYKVSWPKYSNERIDRVKILSQLLQKIDSILLFLKSLKDNVVKFNDDAAMQREFERSLESLALEGKA